MNILTRMIRRTRLLVVSAMAVAAGAVTVVAAGAANGWFDTGAVPTGSGAQVFAQAASSTANGVTLKAMRATFSGTETTVEIAVSQNGQPVTAEVGIPANAVAQDGFAAPVLPSVAAEANAIVLLLPPVVAAGTTTLRIDTLSIGPTSDPQITHGPWVLALAGPSASQFESVMRVEDLVAVTVSVAGHDIAVSGRRSSSRTIVEYSTPSDLLELAPPHLTMQDGTRQLPLATQVLASGTRAEFATTPFGTPVSVGFGPFSEPVADGGTVTVGITAAMARAGASGHTTSEIALTPQDVSQGRPELPLGFSIEQQHVAPSAGRPQDFGRRVPVGDIDVLTIRLKGNWHGQDDLNAPSPYTATPGALNANGTRLRRLGMVTNYSKTQDGSIGEGETTVQFYVEPGMNLDSLTVILGSPSQVLSGEWDVTLHTTP